MVDSGDLENGAAAQHLGQTGREELNRESHQWRSQIGFEDDPNENPVEAAVDSNAGPAGDPNENGDGDEADDDEDPNEKLNILSLSLSLSLTSTH